jgi:hypothetical protein
VQITGNSHEIWIYFLGGVEAVFDIWSLGDLGVASQHTVEPVAKPARAPVLLFNFALRN